MKKILNNKKLVSILMYVIPLITLTIILLTFWPGIYTYDGNFQWNDMSAGNFNSGHPFLSTYFLFILSKIWNNNTILMIFQIFVFSAIWGSICKEMLKEKKNLKHIIIYSIILCLFPIISIYAITAWKDVLYSYYLLAIIYLFYIGSKNKFNYSVLQFILLGILFFLVFSYRHNGMIVAILLMMLLMFIIFRYKNKDILKKSLLMIASFVLSILIITIPKNYYMNKDVVENDEVAVGTIDAYAVWIMGAHINKGYIEAEDLKFLNNIIEIEEWKESYSPFLINATGLAKTRDNKFLVENNEEFRKIFMKYTLNHPLTFMEHYLKADALLWSPLPVGYVYQYDFKLWGPDYGFELEETSVFPAFNNLYEKFVTLTMRRPIRVILYQPATIMYISLLCTFVLVKSLKDKKLWLIITPMIANVLSLAPINLAQDLRYVYINYLTFAFVGLIFVLNFKEVKEYIKLACKKYNLIRRRI